MATKDGSAEFEVKSIKGIADIVKNFVVAAVFTGIVTLAQAAIPPDNSNDGSVPSTSWVNKAINAVISSEAFRQHIVVDYLSEQNGFIKFGDWLGNIILQWGLHSDGTQCTFPITYNVQCYAITFGVHFNNSQYSYDQVESYNVKGFITYLKFSKNLIGMWISIGK